MNRAKMLPDAYAKSTSSNNYKLLQLLNLLLYDTTADLLSIENECCLENARGAILDEYGWMYGQPRNGLSDEQYRVKILGKISRMLSKGSCDEVIALIANMLGVEPSAISIGESDMTAVVYGLTTDMLENTNYKSREITGMIRELIPAGVTLADPVYAGTLGIMGKVDTFESGEKKYTVSYDRNGNYQYFLFNHNPTTPDFIKQMASSQYDEHYPTLAHAWYLGMMSILTGRHNEGDNYDSKKHDIGLSGKGEVPIYHLMYDDNGNFLPSMVSNGFFDDSGTFDGGTLGLISGEDD